NFFNVDNRFFFVDSPGYGYAKRNQETISTFENMMLEYLRRSNLKLTLFLLDSRREISKDDIWIYEHLKENNIPILLIMTKCDKLNQSEKAKMLKMLKEANFASLKVFFYSINDNKVKEQLIEFLNSYFK
ncbi:MAG: 50S ribosome-binding GTPase, partial [Bacillales bacterium]|nr:50S ribosome-binding GTPase [Bacillales bacterium]